MPIDFPSNPQLDELYSAEDRTWRWTGVYWRAVTTTIGYTGSQGEQGEGFRVLGSFPTVEDLPADSSGQPGDAYVITSTGEIWVWDGFNWNNLGQFVGYTGSRGATGFTGSQGRDGNFGGVTLDYTFSSDTDSSLDPGSGKLKFNDVNMLSSTLMYIGDTDDFSVNLDNYLATIDASTSEIRGHFRISRKGMPEQFVMFAITDQTVNQGTYFIVSCSYVSGNLSDSSTAFDDGDDILITFARTGDKGDTGYTGSSGFTGSQGATGTSVRIVGSLATSSQLPVPYVGDIGDGYIVEDTGHLWLWDGTQWNDIGKLTGEVGPTGFTGSQGEIGYTGSEGESTFTWGPTPPENPAIGDRWFDTIVGAVAVYVDDGDTLAWLEVAGSGFMGQTGYTGSGGPSGPRVASIDYPGDATAADPAGGETIGIVGSGFEYGAHVLLDNQAVGQVTFVNANRLEIVAPSKTAGSYAYLYVINADGGVAIHVPGVQYSGLPTWSTPSAGSLGSVYETQTINQSFGAVSDSSVTYSLASGTLPSGSTLDPATGTLSGTAGLVDNATTYTFTIRATDAESQTADRQFSLTIDPDSVTWSFPSAGSVIEIPQDEASTTTLSASAVTGSPVTYSVSALPDGLTLSGDTVSGTATTLGDTAATATASAGATGASASVSFTWRVTLGGDQFFRNTTLLLNADNNTFITDASDNAFTITPNGDTRPSAFSPYNTGWSLYQPSVLDDYLNFGTGDWTFSGDFTIDAWVYHTSASSGDTSLYVLNVGSAYLALNISMTAGVYNIYLNSTAPTSSISHGILANQWAHVAMVRSSGTITLYTNGVAKGTINNFSTVGYNNPTINRCGGGVLGEIVARYISNFRILRGTAIDFSTAGIPTSPVSVSTANQILLTAYGNRSADFNTTVAAKTVTVTGSPKVTAFAPFTETDTSTGSGYFDGTSDNITAPNNAAFDLSTDDFTISCWIYPVATGVYRAIVQYSNGVATNSNYCFAIAINSDNTIRFDNFSGNSQETVTGGAVAINTWSFITVTRSGSSATVYVNGSGTTDTVYATSNLPSGSLIRIGSQSDLSTPFFGYISNLRIVKGSATAPGSNPTSPLTADANTSLLTLQNRIGYNNSQPIDESGIRNIITRNGNASAGTFSPHVPTGWSAYFDGTGDYLTVPDNAAFDFNAAFTIEGWLYLNAYTNVVLIDTRNTGPDGYTLATVSGELQLVKAGGQVLLTTAKITLNSWTHFAVVRDASNNVSIFLNGSRDGTTTNSGTWGADATVHIGAKSYSGSGLVPVNGHISNLRIVKGTAVYDPTSTTLTIPTAPLEPIAGTSLLTLRGPSFTDDSANRFAITRNGDTRITPFSPFAPHTRAPLSHSVYFDGTGDYLSLSNDDAFNPETQDFVMEAWVYLTGTTGNNQGINGKGTTGSNGYSFFITNSRVLSFIWNGTGGATITAGTLSLNTWHHVAVVRNSNVIRLYLDGVGAGSSTSCTTNITSTTIKYVGQARGANPILGYMSNYRMIKGSLPSGYDATSSSLIPPTAPLTAISGTSLLTCQSSTVVDNSDNAFALTVNGNSQPTQFNPFGETVSEGVEYSPVLHGGSVYFDGTGDYLSSGTSTAYTLGTGDFTIEAWLYNFGYAGTQYGRGWCTLYSTAGNYMMLRLNTGSDQLNMWMYLAPTVYFNNYSTALITPYSWTHAAFVRQSGTFKLYINGTLDTTISGVTVGLDHNRVEIGRNDNGYPLGDWNGYISNHRIVKGTAVYTSAFVPPAAPADPIPGTTLLVNGTNAAIQDKTGKNVLETVGNARVVNGVKKYGSGAMSFDGTGDYLVMPRTSELTLGGSDFTIECWVYTAGGAAQIIYSSRTGSTYNGWLFGINASNYLVIVADNNGSAPWAIDNSASNTGSTVPLSEWVHIALSREGSSWRTFINGTLNYTVTSSISIYEVDASVTIGADQKGASSVFNGYIDDLRITKGVARTITLPTSAFRLR